MRARRPKDRQTYSARPTAQQRSGLAGGFVFFLLVLIVALAVSAKI